MSALNDLSFFARKAVVYRDSVSPCVSYCVVHPADLVCMQTGPGSSGLGLLFCKC